MALRYLILGLGVGLATALFNIFSKTHPLHYILSLSTICIQELLTTILFQRLPTINEQLDQFEPDFKLSGTTPNGIILGIVDVDLMAN